MGWHVMGVEWNPRKGMEWNGNGMGCDAVEWEGMEWSGVGWSGMKWNGLQISTLPSMFLQKMYEKNGGNYGLFLTFVEQCVDTLTPEIKVKK